MWYKARRVLLPALLAVAVFGLLAVPALVFEPAPKAVYGADKTEAIQTLKDFGNTFAEVAEAASPAVVSIQVSREVEVVHEGNRDWTSLTFVINEGPRYTVRNVAFVGNSKFKTEFLERDLKLKSGEHFNQSKMDADLGMVRDIYGGRGFVFADVQADPRFLEEVGVDRVLDLDEPERS